MAVPWGLIIFLVGMAYGYFKTGRQDKGALFKTGLIWGAIIAAILALLGGLAGVGALGIGTSFLAMLLSFIILTVLFVAGAFVGDWIEDATAS